MADERETLRGVQAANAKLAEELASRRRADAALQESEECYRRLFMEAREGMALADAETGTLLDCNVAFAQLTGYTREELIGRPARVLHPAGQGDERLTWTFVRHLESHAAQTLTSAIVTKSGDITPVEITGHALILRGRRVVQGFFRDLTEVARYGQERETSLHLLEVLNKQEQSRDLIRAVTTLLQRWTGCDAVGIRLRDGEDFPYYETQGFPEAFVLAERELCVRDAAGDVVRDAGGNPLLECMCGNVLCGRTDSRLPFFTAKGSFWSNGTSALLASTSEADRQARTRNRCNGEGYESVALIPLSHANVTLGLLQLNDRRSGRFTPDLLAFLEGAADQVALALAQRQAQTDLRASEARYRQIVEMATEGVWAMDADHRTTFVNARMAAMLGYEEAEVLGRPVEAFMFPADLAAHRARMEQRHRGQDAAYEHRFRRKDGTEVWAIVSAKAVTDEDGGFQGSFGMFTDITARKQAEAALQQSRDLLEATQQLAHVGSWQFEVAADRLTWSEETYRIFGLAPEGFAGTYEAFLEHVHPDDRARVDRAYRDALRDGRDTYEIEHRIVRPQTGEIRHVFERCVRERDAAGHVARSVGMVQDITDRKRADSEREALHTALLNRTRHLETVRAVSTEIARELDLGSLLRLILKRAVDLVGAGGGTLLLWDAARQVLVPQARCGGLEILGRMAIPVEEGVVGRVAGTRTGLIVNDYGNWPGAIAGSASAAGVTAVMGEPLLYRDELVGVVGLAHVNGAGTFTTEDATLLRLFADQAAIAIENAQLLAAAQRRGQELEALLTATQTAAAGLDLHATLEGIAAAAAKIARCEHIKLLLVDQKTRTLHAGVMHGVAGPEGFLLPIGRGLSGTVAETGQPLYVADTQNDPRSLFADFDRSVGFRTYLGLPITVRDEVLGVLTFNTREAREYSAEELAYLRTFADHAAIALEKARLFASEQQRRRQMEAVRSVAEEITRVLDLDRLLALILQRAAELVQAPAGEIALWDPATECLISRTQFGGREAVTPSRTLPRGEGLMGRVAAARRGQIVNDYRAWPGARPDTLEHTAVTAALCEPLLYREQLVGVLNVVHVHGRGSFALADQEILRLFTSHAAIAIENATLFAAARTRAAQLARLITLARTLAAQRDLAHVIPELLAAIPALLPGAAARVWERTTPEGSELRATGSIGLRDPERATQALLTTTQGVAGLAFASRTPIAVADIATDPHYEAKAWAAAEGLVSALVVPLFRAEEPLAALTISTREPHIFADTEVALFQALGDHAAIALENARLFRAQEEAYQALRGAQEELVRTEKLRALGQMSAGVAHDLNNALAAVLGQVDLARLQAPPPALADALAAIETAATDGAAVVRRLQDFARPRGTSTLVECDLTALVRETLDMTRPRWRDAPQRSGVTVAVDLDMATPLPISGNASEVREALTNLIFNAVDAMPQGGLLTFRGERTAAGETMLTVADTGIGMTPGVQARIFEPFFTTKGVQGTGLGLAVVYGIIERHRGRISVASTPGHGTTFTLTFPAPGVTTPTSPSPGPAPVVSPMRVLIVDDDEAVRTTLAQVLATLGHLVSQASESQAALATLATSHLDVVLTDLGMPGMNGWQLARRVKAAQPQLPVILLTGWQDQAPGDEADRATVDRVLGKPVRMDDLLFALAEVTRGRVRGGEADSGETDGGTAHSVDR